MVLLLPGLVIRHRASTLSQRHGVLDLLISKPYFPSFQSRRYLWGKRYIHTILAV